MVCRLDHVIHVDALIRDTVAVEYHSTGKGQPQGSLHYLPRSQVIPAAVRSAEWSK